MSGGEEAEDGIRDLTVTGVQTCALPISSAGLCDGAVARGRRAGRDSRVCADEEEPAGHADSRYRQAGGSRAARTSDVRGDHNAGAPDSFRSEERRVGKECRCREARKQKTAYEI